MSRLPQNGRTPLPVLLWCAYNTRHGFSDLDFDWHGCYGRFRPAYDDFGLPGPVTARHRAVGPGRAAAGFAREAVYRLRAGQPHPDVGLFPGRGAAGQPRHRR